MGEMLLEVVCLLLGIYTFIVFARVLSTWVTRPPEPLLPVFRGLAALTDPLLRPLRERLPTLSLGGLGLDLSPLVLIFGLIILRSIVCAA